MADNIFTQAIKLFKNGLPIHEVQPGSLIPTRYTNVNKNLANFIAPVQLSRIRADMKALRDSMSEAELAWYPHRVKQQQLYIDTILNGHVLACMNKRQDLTLLREWDFVNEAGEKNEDLKQLFKKPWFDKFIKYSLQAQFFGYSLISLGDVTNNEFKQLKLIKRWNVSPDRLNVTQFIYSISGVSFMEGDPAKWHVWVPTDNDIGVSDVGYGLLYPVAIYEILARNLLGNNADAAELYGMPIRVGKTNKTEEDERAEFIQAMLNMGSAGAILLDTMDELELVESKSMGQGYKIFPDLEARLEKKISKIFLGHADALDSTPGKLGAQQGDSPAEIAMKEKQLVDGSNIEDIVNSILIPKMMDIGFIINNQYKFKYSNNSELIQVRKDEDANNLQTATVAKTMADAGLKMDAKYFTERTGIECTEIVAPAPIAATKADLSFTKEQKNKLTKLYGK